MLKKIGAIVLYMIAYAAMWFLGYLIGEQLAKRVIVPAFFEEDC